MGYPVSFGLYHSSDKTEGDRHIIIQIYMFIEVENRETTFSEFDDDAIERIGQAGLKERALNAEAPVGI